KKNEYSELHAQTKIIEALGTVFQKYGITIDQSLESNMKQIIAFRDNLSSFGNFRELLMQDGTRITVRKLNLIWDAALCLRNNNTLHVNPETIVRILWAIITELIHEKGVLLPEEPSYDEFSEEFVELISEHLSAVSPRDKQYVIRWIKTDIIQMIDSNNYDEEQRAYTLQSLSPYMEQFFGTGWQENAIINNEISQILLKRFITHEAEQLGLKQTLRDETQVEIIDYFMEKRDKEDLSENAYEFVRKSSRRSEVPGDYIHLAQLLDMYDYFNLLETVIQKLRQFEWNLIDNDFIRTYLSIFGEEHTQIQSGIDKENELFSFNVIRLLFKYLFAQKELPHIDFTAKGKVLLPNDSSTNKIGVFDFDLVLQDGFGTLKETISHYGSQLQAIVFFHEWLTEEQMMELLQTRLDEDSLKTIVCIELRKVNQGFIFEDVIGQLASQEKLKKILGEKRLLLQEIFIVGCLDKKKGYGIVENVKTYFAHTFTTFSQIILTVLYSDNRDVLERVLIEIGFTKKEAQRMLPQNGYIPPHPKLSVRSCLRELDDIRRFEQVIETAA
ncbi:hypothetical protein ACFL1T_03395, partial [Chlamydiota bacterium]